MPLEAVRSPAPDVTLEGEDDVAVALADSWRDRPAVLLFLRHFG